MPEVAAEKAALASKSGSHSPRQPLHARGLGFLICKMAAKHSSVNLGVRFHMSSWTVRRGGDTQTKQEAGAASSREGEGRDEAWGQLHRSPQSQQTLCLGSQFYWAKHWWGTVPRDPGPLLEEEGQKKAPFISTIEEPPATPARCALKCQAVGRLWSGLPSRCLGPGSGLALWDLRKTSVKTRSHLGLQGSCAQKMAAPPLSARRGHVPRKPRDMECFGHCPDTHSRSRAGQERAGVTALLTRHARWETGL